MSAPTSTALQSDACCVCKIYLMEKYSDKRICLCVVVVNELLLNVQLQDGGKYLIILFDSWIKSHLAETYSSAGHFF